MQVSGMSGITGSGGQLSQQWQLRQQNVKSLTYALQSGNLNGARAAYQSLMGNAGSGRGSGAGTLAEVGRALGNGDLAGARRALRATMDEHHHVHHAPAASRNSSPRPAAVGGAAVTGAPPGFRIDKRA